jgi:hypothetical protein
MLAQNDPVIATPAPSEPPPGVAVVVFVGKATLFGLRLLRRGYRHCLVLVATERGWALQDPQLHRTEMSVLAPLPLADVVTHFRRQGCAVVVSKVHSPPPRLAPPAPHTCVESVKRVLGLHARWVLTPRQLWRRLRMDAGKIGKKS